MANPDLLTKLYQRMSAEQAQYRSWLLDLPPAEILNHAAEDVWCKGEFQNPCMGG